MELAGFSTFKQEKKGVKVDSAVGRLDRIDVPAGRRVSDSYSHQRSSQVSAKNDVGGIGQPRQDREQHKERAVTPTAPCSDSRPSFVSTTVPPPESGGTVDVPIPKECETEPIDKRVAKKSAACRKDAHRAGNNEKPSSLTARPPASRPAIPTSSVCALVPLRSIAARDSASISTAAIKASAAETTVVTAVDNSRPSSST